MGYLPVIAIFLGFDLLASVVALFGGSIIVLLAPLMSVARGHELMELSIVTLGPLIQSHSR